MPLHPFGFNNFVVQLYISIDTPGADTPWDVSADGSSVEKTLFLDGGGAASVWEVVVAGSCVFFRSSDLPLSQALHHPGYVTGALIPTAKKVLIDCCCVSCPTLQI